jgi:hypothetical protein
MAKITAVIPEPTPEYREDKSKTIKRRFRYIEE